MVKGAWVTLATNDSYSLGALVLAHSLKQVGTQKELAILVTPGVTTSMRARLFEVFNSVKEVNILDSKDKANLKLLQRPELGITFTKLHCWQLTEYEKCVFLDADTLVLQNCDELFEREELSAAPDVGWPDCFNSGVFVYRPSEDTYNNLIQFALDKGSFDGGDQGLLNLYFSDWARKDISKHLPFIYNVCSTAFYSYLPAFKQFGKDVKIVHFIGNAKPWLQYFDTESKKVRPSRDLGHLEPILQKWWNIFCSMIHPNLTSDMSGLAGAFARLTLGQQRTPEQEALEDSLRRQNWEQGNIDYLGRDSFDNIWSKICQTLAKGPQESEGENSQIKPEDSVLPSPQQESVKEDIISASQEAPRSTDSQSVIESQEKPSTVPIPLPSSAEISPDKVPTTGISVSSIPEKIPTPEVEAVAIEPIVAEKNFESKTVPTPTENIITEKRSSATEIAVSKIVDQVLSDSEPSTKEVSNVIEQSIESQSPPQETPKPEIIPLTKPAEEESPKDVLSAEQVGPEKVSVPAPVSSKPEDPKQEEKISESQNISSAEKTNTSSTIQSESSPAVQEIPLSPEIAVCPIKSIPPTGETPSMKETSPQIPTAEQTTKMDAPTTEIIPSTEQSSISEKTSAPLEKASAPVEAPKTEQTSSEKTPPLTEKACSLEKVPPPKTQATPQQEATSVPIAAEPKTSSSAEPITPPTSTVTATPTLTSSEPPPPITAPPRKNGGKKQNKSKK